jgi:hypothetical protein
VSDTYNEKKTEQLASRGATSKDIGELAESLRRIQKGSGVSKNQIEKDVIDVMKNDKKYSEEDIEEMQETLKRIRIHEKIKKR